MVPDLGQTSSSSRVYGLAKGQLMAWAHSKMTLGRKIVCVFVRVPWRSNASKGNCVQSSFSFNLIGLVFLDLGSRHKDQPLISCSWQLRWCLLFIGQHRMDHITRHFCTSRCRLMEREVSRCLPKAAVAHSSGSPYLPYSLVLPILPRHPCLSAEHFLG